MHIVNDGNQALAKPEKVYEAEIVDEPARIVVVAVPASPDGESVAEPVAETVEETVESAKIIIEEPAKATAPKEAKAVTADHATKQVVSFIAAAILMISLIALGTTPALPF